MVYRNNDRTNGQSVASNYTFLNVLKEKMAVNIENSSRRSYGLNKSGKPFKTNFALSAIYRYIAINI
jgi:hypothetical protein